VGEKTGLTRLTGSGDGSGDTCGEADCPNIYATDRRTYVVQGQAFTGFRPSDGEVLAEIPESTPKEAFRALGW
jgi:hypothetical protein